MSSSERRETITRSAEAEYVHKKILGNAGEFAIVKIRLDPLPRGGGIQFVNEIIPYELHEDLVRGVEEGIREAAKSGVVQGGPAVDFKASLFDAKYHEADSNAQTFNLAAQSAFWAAMRKAGPVILF